MSRTKRHETRRGEQSGERKREREGKGRTIGDKIVSLKRIGEERGGEDGSRKERALSLFSLARATRIEAERVVCACTSTRARRVRGE